MPKLDSYGFWGAISSVIGGYLSDRKQYVSYNGTNTLCLNVEKVFNLRTFSVFALILRSDCKLAIFAGYTTIIKADLASCWSFHRSIIRMILSK